MRVAYADPPYIGQAHRYPEKREVDHCVTTGGSSRSSIWPLSKR